MIPGKTKSGFDFKISEEQMDDYELLEGLVEIDKGNQTAIIDVISRLLGEEQKNKLKEHLRGANGRVTASGMITEITNIFEICNQGKNS